MYKNQFGEERSAAFILSYDFDEDTKRIRIILQPSHRPAEQVEFHTEADGVHHCLRTVDPNPDGSTVTLYFNPPGMENTSIVNALPIDAGNKEAAQKFITFVILHTRSLDVNPAQA